jgi:hypothetical protein
MVTVVKDNYASKKKPKVLDDNILLKRLEGAIGDRLTVPYYTISGKERGIEGILVKVNAESDSILIRNDRNIDIELRFRFRNGKEIARMVTSSGTVLYESKPATGLNPAPLLRNELKPDQQDMPPDESSNIKDNENTMHTVKHKNRFSDRSVVSWNEFREAEVEERGEQRKPSRIL